MWQIIVKSWKFCVDFSRFLAFENMTEKAEERKTLEPIKILLLFTEHNGWSCHSRSSDRWNHLWLFVFVCILTDFFNNSFTFWRAVINELQYFCRNGKLLKQFYWQYFVCSTVLNISVKHIKRKIEYKLRSSSSFSWGKDIH